MGAGFAGLSAAKHLAKADVEITIVDRRNFHLFQPLLYQVATAALNPSDIAYPIRSIFRKQRNVASILLAEVVGVDCQGRTVQLEDGECLGYEYLIVAAGATHSYFGHDEWRKHAPGLKTVEDALDMRRRIFDAYEQAERYPDLASEYLNFVVVGAGPTGVELAGAMVEIAVHALRQEFDRIDPGQAHVTLVEASSRVLAAYTEPLGKSARRQLEELGVEVRTDTLVTEISERSVVFDDGSTLPTRTVFWAAGVQAADLMQELGSDRDRVGRVVVQPDLSLDGHPEVFVIGDAASVTSQGKPVPGTAPAAMQQGRHAAEQILADLSAKPRNSFRYRDKGSLATIGRARAVAQLPRLHFSGVAAWLAWLFVHVFFLIGFRNRTFVILSWAWNYITFRRGARIITKVGSGREK